MIWTIHSYMMRTPAAKLVTSHRRPVAEDQRLALLAPLADPGLDLLPCALAGPQAHGMGLSEYLTKIHRVRTPQLLGRRCGVREIDPSPLRQPQAAERGLRDPEPGLFPG
jgi:hypothetical protein